MEDTECQKALVAKLLGYLLILGSLTIKAPQVVGLVSEKQDESLRCLAWSDFEILGRIFFPTGVLLSFEIIKILAAKSVDGLAPSSIYSDLLIYIVNAVYHVVTGSPFSAYGEIVTIFLQNAILVLLMWRFMKDRPSGLGIAMIIAGFVATAGACAMLPRDYMALLPLSNLPLIIVAKVPQIVANLKNGHTGQLAAITTLLNFVGASVRILTTIQEVGWDLGLLSMHGLSSLLNGALALQIVLYWERTAQWSAVQAHKKTA